MTGPILEVEGLDVVYRVRGGRLQALDDVGFQVGRGEVLGIVGESGCGKSTLSSAILRLLPPNGEITAGRVVVNGRNVLELDADRLRDLRGREIAMVFQDPMTSLNPTLSVGTQMLDAQRAHDRRGGDGAGDLRRRALTTLEQVGIPDAVERFDRYPHEFSGGMRQRIMIAMALMLEPSVLIADEVTSALDVTLAAQILRLLRRLCEERDTALLLISHDLGVIAQICDRVIVMYAGQAVEEADVVSLFDNPLHPYTRALLSSVPSRGYRGEPLATIPGRVPSLSALPPGCRFADRCPYVQPVNREKVPGLLELEGRRVRCNMYDPKSGYEGVSTPQREESP